MCYTRFVEAKSKCKVEVEREKSKKMIAYLELVNQAQRSQEEVVQASLVMHLLKHTNEGLVTKIHQYLRFGRMNDEDNSIFVEISISDCKNQLELIL